MGHLYVTDPKFMQKDINGLAEAICAIAAKSGVAWATFPDHGTCEQRARAAYTGGYYEYNWEVNHQPYDPFQVCTGIVP